jgi:hypothetical protein
MENNRYPKYILTIVRIDFKMSFRYLYYPSIELPNDSWLRKILLYSDNIASIVPKDLGYQINNTIEDLKNSNEYHMLSPEDFFNDSRKLNEFETEVESYLSSKSFQSLLKNDKNKAPAEIYGTKFTHVIEDFLIRNRLTMDTNSNWHTVPKLVSDTYLGILARYIGEKHFYIPTTNDVKNVELVLNSTSSTEKKQIGELMLINCLPTPSHDESIKKILNFKKERQNELLHFRKIIREYSEKVSSAENQNELLEVIQIFNEDLQIGVNEISSLLNEKNIRFGLESFNTLLDVKQPALLSIVGGYLSHVFGPSPLVGVLTGATAGSLINVGTQYISSRLDVKQTIRESPYSYVFHSQRFNPVNNKFSLETILN